MPLLSLGVPNQRNVPQWLVRSWICQQDAKQELARLFTRLWMISCIESGSNIR